MTKTTPHTSVVTLVTDPSIGVSCDIEIGAGRPLRGTLAGGSRDALKLTHLRTGAALPPASRVTVSGRGGVFPAGLAVGTVQRCAADLRSAEVTPAVDFNELEDVFIRREK